MKDIYSEVTNRIVAALEQGTPPWVCPWRQGSALPNNLATGKAYRKCLRWRSRLISLG